MSLLEALGTYAICGLTVTGYAAICAYFGNDRFTFTPRQWAWFATGTALGWPIVLGVALVGRVRQVQAAIEERFAKQQEIAARREAVERRWRSMLSGKQS